MLEPSEERWTIPFAHVAEAVALFTIVTADSVLLPLLRTARGGRDCRCRMQSLLAIFESKIFLPKLSQFTLLILRKTRVFRTSILPGLDA